MKMASKILLATLVAALTACGSSSQGDVDKAAHDRAADIAKAQQAAQPALDAANRDVAKAQQDANLKIADARADANHEIDNATAKQTKQQAKANYDVAVTAADGDLAVQLEKCGMQPADTRSTCENNAHATHDQAVAAATTALKLADAQTD
jgi:hypothetical protein